MSATLLLITFLIYTCLLFLIAQLTSKKADNQAFFNGNRRSNWFLVAYGMIGASLSGVSFMSVPGNVYRENFYYLPMLLGFIFGYLIIALVLIPLYFRMNLTSIYTYLEKRFGVYSYKTGASFFIISRLLGASVRTFLVIFVLYNFVLKDIGIPFGVAALLFVLLALLYTLKGGVKTIVWTDTLQTTFMIAAIVVSVIFICKELNWSALDLFNNVKDSSYSNMFNTDIEASSNWIKRFLSGVLIPIAMTGLDQAMMQKSLSCKNIKEAKKNIITSVLMMIPINILFLVLGAILSIYINAHPQLLVEVTSGSGSVDADKIFPTIAFSLKPLVGVIFFIGLISAAYPTCANALTSLTTSTCIDIIGFSKKDWTSDKKTKIRWIVSGVVTILFILLIIVFNILKNDAVINMVYQIAAYTYGPLLGLFIFGIITKLSVKDKFVPLVCIFSPIVCFIIEQYIFNFGFSLIAVCALVTFIGLLILKNK